MWNKIEIFETQIEIFSEKSFLIKCPDPYKNYKFWYPKKMVFPYGKKYHISFKEDFKVTIFNKINKKMFFRRHI